MHEGHDAEAPGVARVIAVLGAAEDVLAGRVDGPLRADVPGDEGEARGRAVGEPRADAHGARRRPLKGNREQPVVPRDHDEVATPRLIVHADAPERRVDGLNRRVGVEHRGGDDGIRPQVALGEPADLGDKVGGPAVEVVVGACGQEGLRLRDEDARLGFVGRACGARLCDCGVRVEGRRGGKDGLGNEGVGAVDEARGLVPCIGEALAGGGEGGEDVLANGVVALGVGEERDDRLVVDEAGDAAGVEKDPDCQGDAARGAARRIVGADDADGGERAQGLERGAVEDGPGDNLGISMLIELGVLIAHGGDVRVCLPDVALVARAHVRMGNQRAEGVLAHVHGDADGVRHAVVDRAEAPDLPASPLLVGAYHALRV